MKKHPILHTITSIIALAVFVMAIFVLRHEARGHSMQDVIIALGQLSRLRLALAFCLTTAYYIVLTTYDALAFRFIKHKLPYLDVALASFIGHAFSNSLGFAPITSGSLRFRIYSQKGVTPMQILNVIAFTSITFWLGFLTVATALFLIAPPVIPSSFNIPFETARPLGFLFLLAIILWLGWSTLRHRKEFTLCGHTFCFPPLRISLLQMGLASLEWLFSAGIVFTLIPSSGNVPYHAFLGVFLLAQIAGLISQIPGGLGVFESIVLALMSGTVPVPAVMATLFVYRLFFNILPLALAILLIGLRELKHRHKHVLSFLRRVKDESSGAK